MSLWLRVAIHASNRGNTLAFSTIHALLRSPRTFQKHPQLVPLSASTLQGTTRHASSGSNNKHNKHNKHNKEAKVIETGSKDFKSKDNKIVSTANLVPGSKQPIINEAAREEYSKAEATMRTAIEWFRKECATAESRASGRVTPALLAPVRVKQPGATHAVGLEQIATVGVRDGTTLIVTVFDESVSY